MCGIFGLIVNNPKLVSPDTVRSLVRALFTCSETRGREASGACIRSAAKLEIYKTPSSASVLMGRDDFWKMVDGALNCFQNSNGQGIRPFQFIGHSRLATDGASFVHENNQPVVIGSTVGVHNGIIVNADHLRTLLKAPPESMALDSIALFARLDELLTTSSSIEYAVKTLFKELDGEASIAALTANSDSTLIATNCGSLYVARDAKGKIVLFASEEAILLDVLKRVIPTCMSEFSVSRVDAGTALTIGANLDCSSFELYSLSPPSATTEVASNNHQHGLISIVDHSLAYVARRNEMIRCTRCLIPVTFPLVQFDSEGVCSLCIRHAPSPPLGVEALSARLSELKAGGRDHPVLVGLSGGRDSCYGLFLIKKVLGINAIAFSYDWGMITDLARRNMSRVCGRLGIEHIIVSADIRHKRRVIRENVTAWLKKPHLGMLPIITAGDKQFYFHANRLLGRTRSSAVIFCENERYEKTYFKSGFCGVDERTNRLFNIPKVDKLRLLTFYAKQSLINPGYWHRGLLDGFAGFISAYTIPHKYEYLFRFLPWEEGKVVATLRDELDWELAQDTTSTWRIGDGSAAFYNFVYHTIAGFSEHDTFRSHQIRDGVLSRSEALSLVVEENKPRWASIEWYLRTIGLDPAEVIPKIYAMPKLY